MKDALEEALHSDYNEDDLEFLTFQLNEIDEAQLQEEELEALEQEQKRMMAYEKLSSSASQAVALLDEGSVSSIYESYRLRCMRMKPLRMRLHSCWICTMRWMSSAPASAPIWRSSNSMRAVSMNFRKEFS